MGLENFKFIPLGDRILVEPLAQEEIPAKGIIIPATAAVKPNQGTVIVAGRGKIKDDGTLVPMEVKPGDKVLYGKYGGLELKLDEKDYLLLHQDDILGVV